MVIIAIVAAMAAVLMWIQFPLLPAAPYLQYDFSDVPVLIGTFALGPMAGFLIATIKAAVFFFTKGTHGPIGTIMNWSSTAIFVVVAGLIYQYQRTKTGALLGMLAGTLVFTTAMVFLNIYFALPAWGIPAEQIAGLVKAAVVPFNLLRGGISSIITLLLYKRASLLIKQG